MLLLLCVAAVSLLLLDSESYLLAARTVHWSSAVTPAYLRGSASLASLPMDSRHFLTQRVVVCGLLRDKASQVPYLQRSLPRITDHFQDWALVVVENDSQDSTRALLQDWQSQEPQRVFVLEPDDSGDGGLSDAAANVSDRTVHHDYSEQRITKMAALRNTYLRFVQQHPVLAAFELLLVLDLDLQSFVYEDGLWSSAFQLQRHPAIAAVAANGLQMTNVALSGGWLQLLLYQDPYAHEDEHNAGKQSGQRWDNLRSNFVNRFHYGQPLHPVRSAFSGLTLYRMQALAGLRYRVERAGQHVLCEHVGLNRQLPGAGMFLNPSMAHIVVDNSDGAGGDDSPARRNLDVAQLLLQR